MDLPSPFCLRFSTRRTRDNAQTHEVLVPRLDLTSIAGPSNRGPRKDLPGLSCEAFAQLWEPSHFDAALHEHSHPASVTGSFGNIATKWQVVAPALRGHAACFVPLPVQLWQQERASRELGEWLESILKDLRKGERAVLLPLSIGQTQTTGLQFPLKMGSLMSLAVWLPAQNRRHLFAAFNDKRLDLGGHLRLDLALCVEPHRYDSFSEEDAQAIIRQAPSQDAPPLAAQDDNDWFFHAFCHASGFFAGAASARLEWRQQLCRLWVNEHGEGAHRVLQQALHQASDHWAWMHLPKASSPLEFTTKEQALVEQLEELNTVAKAHNWPLAPRFSLALDTIAQRREKMQQSQAASAPPHAGQLKDAHSTQQKLAQALPAHVLASRRELALTSIEQLDVPALRWVLGEGGLRGADLSFVLGNSRGGPLEALARAAGHLRGKGKAGFTPEQRIIIGVQLLSELNIAGYDPFVLPKGSSRRQNEDSNVFARCAGPFLDCMDSSNALTEALAVFLVERCKRHGLSFVDARAWTQALRDKTGHAYSNSFDDAPDAFCDRLLWAIEREELQAALTHGDNQESLFMGGQAAGIAWTASLEVQESSAQAGEDDTDREGKKGGTGRRQSRRL